MICISLKGNSVEGCMESVAVACSQAASFGFPADQLVFEIRADLGALLSADVSRLVSLIKKDCSGGACKVLVTCREGDSRGDVLEAAVLAGADYVDLELDAQAGLFSRIMDVARMKGCRVVVSHHDFSDTPSVGELRSIYDRAVAMGADIVKIVTTAETLPQASRILALYRLCRGNVPLVAFTMGAKTRFTRELCLRMGSPFTYVSIDRENAVAPGQYSLREMLSLVSSFRNAVVLPKDSSLFMHTQVPVSKSIAQRAILASALSPGVSVLRGLDADLSREAADVRSALDFVRNLGASVAGDADGSISVRGIGAGCADVLPSCGWDVGESGLLLRMALPLAMFFLWRSHDCNSVVSLYGHGTLCRRRFDAELGVLREYGIEAFYRLADAEGADAGACVEVLPEGALWKSIELREKCQEPVTGKGKCVFRLDGSGSSQMVSGFLMMMPLVRDWSLMAGNALSGTSQESFAVEVSRPSSVPYLEMTVDVLRKFGVFYSCEDMPDSSGLRFVLLNGMPAPVVDMRLEADWSSAACLLVAQCIMGLEPDLGNLCTGTSQADERLYALLESVRRDGELIAFDFDASDCPDLFPALVLLACHCNGTSRISGLHRLSNKESDRAVALLSEFSVLGYALDVEEDSFLVEGCSAEQCLQPCEDESVAPVGKRMLRTYGDHRMVMALAVASLFSEAECLADSVEGVRKSFPGFPGLQLLSVR